MPFVVVPLCILVFGSAGFILWRYFQHIHINLTGYLPGRCPHNVLTWPRKRQDGSHYRACIDCGAEVPYNGPLAPPIIEGRKVGGK